MTQARTVWIGGVALLAVAVGYLAMRHETRVVYGQMTINGGTTVPVTGLPVVPTKLSQMTNDVGFIGFAPFNVTFPATSLLAIGTYGPTTVTVPSAVMGQAVECNLTNFQSTAYKATDIVTATGTAAITLSVTTPLTTNTTAPVARCFTY